MAVWDLYSKRRKRELGETADVYTYDSVPIELRRQIIHLWGDAIGVPYYRSHDQTEEVQKTYLSIAKVLRREYGLFKLSRSVSNPEDKIEAYDELTSWILEEENLERVLDGIELSFRIIDHFCSQQNYLRHRPDNKKICDAAIEELNIRLKEHAIGYQYTDGSLVRVDSALIHTEAVIPALAVLRGSDFANAQTEFLSAFEHFRHGKKQEALVDCLKCFESTMKVICDKRGWSYDPKATAKDLVAVCFDRGLIPPYWQTHIGGLRSVLESGIPTARNRQAGHGAGSGPAPDLPDELVAYVLHMTASTILFLTEAEKSLPPTA